MCLKGTAFTPQELLAAIPGDKFVCFKFVNLRGGKLISPSFHYEWKPGVNKALGNMGSQDTGLYLFLVDPNVLNAADQEVVIPVIVRREHVKRGGPDNHNNVGGSCLIVTECEITQEAYDDAVSGKSKETAVARALELAKSFTKQVKTKIKQGKKDEVSKVKETKKKIKEIVVKNKEAEKKEAGSKAAKSIKKVIKKAKKVAKKVIKKKSKDNPSDEFDL